MCLIVMKGPGIALPKDENLIHAEKRNSDGIGLMYYKPNTNDVMIKKDFINAKHLIAWCKDNIKVEDTLVIHFRYATHGLKDVGNRHPFPITHNKELLRKPELLCQIAVAHNGVINNYGHHAKYSDTQKFVLDILAEDSVKNNIEAPAIQKLINNFIDGDKLAILRNDGFCLRFGEWEESEGIYYSNTGYKPYDNFYNNWIGFRRDNWGEDNSDLNNKQLQLNSYVSEDNNNNAYVGECDGCKQKKLVRYVEIEDNAYCLCKKCRKNVKKGRLTIEKLDKDLLQIACDACGEFFDEKDLVPVDGGQCKVCDKCHILYLQGELGMTN